MSPLWTAEEAATATGGVARGHWVATGVSIDTRTLRPGDLFIALSGENRDGHDFVPDALAKGACAMVSVVAPDIAKDAPLLVVGDTQRGLEDLGRAARARSRARIAAITGSAGKTTTKEMLRTALSGRGTVAASAASYNNHWGVPLSLARMDRATDYGVFEIGMNHEGEIRALVRQVRPHVAVITTVAPAHLEYFGTIEAIADAKAEIFAGLEPDGTAILPADNAQYARLRTHAETAGVNRIFTFGRSPDCTARLLSAEPDGTGQRISTEIDGTALHFSVGAAGAHIAANAMAVLLAARALGVNVGQAAAALEGFAPLAGRGARVRLGDIDLIDESYNANPASVAAALDLLRAARPGPGGRRIAVLGDMLELGRDGAALHRALAPDVAASGAAFVFLCGAQMRALWQALPPARRGAYAETSAALVPEVLAQLRPGDVVLVKGSFGSRMSAIVDALRSRDAATA